MQPITQSMKIAFALGIATAIGAGILYTYADVHAIKDYLAGEEPHTHESTEVHVHSDFLFIANGERVRFNDDRYQSATGHVLLEDMHFHDHDDNVIHRHADGLTLGVFFESLGVTLTNDCITLDTSEAYCTNDENKFLVFVNGERNDSPSTYINQENDQILFYYGPEDVQKIEQYMHEVSSDACIYSYTCPERGTPPPEACGLTCEL